MKKPKAGEIPAREFSDRVRRAAEPIEIGEREELHADIAKIKAEAQEQKKATIYWRNKAEQLTHDLAGYQATWDVTPTLYPIKAAKRGANSETIPVLLCSDWHCEERVDPRAIGDANEFNLDIAEARIGRLTATAMKLIDLKRAGTNIRRMVLWLGGDMITGAIHEENLSTCSLSPVEAIIWVQNRIYSMIQFFLDEGKFDEIIIPCSCGNHSRTTKKKHIARQTQTSFEWGMFNNLSREFKNDKRVKFVLTPGHLCILNLFDKYKIRFHHGDSIKYKDGIGGLTIPLHKRIARWNENGREVYLDCLGHWHSFTPGRKFIANGSLIGYNAFAQECGFPVEAPEQTLFFVEQKHGLTGIEPIFL